MANGDIKVLDAKLKKELATRCTEMQERPLRVIGLAIKQGMSSADMPTDPAKFEATETNMIFVGFAGIKDPARPEVKSAIDKC
eukprot:SAG31_NODE_10159_length_1176_cov_1.734448_2_plen_82_part_01